jgi:hypothetical protein
LAGSYPQQGNDAFLKVQLNGTNAGSANGLVIQAANTTIRGLVINRFGGNGILLSGSVATGNQVSGNFIGTIAAGTKALGNADDGVDVFGADNNAVGGTTAGARNVISGNGADGEDISQAEGNTIGGTVTAARNVISANGGDGS